MYLLEEFLILLIVALISTSALYKKREDKTKCPTVKSVRNFDIHGLLGSWYVVQYYATSEEEVIYRCMRAIFSMPNSDEMEIEMNITYSFIDDPNNEMLVGNITWNIPDPNQPAHWVHAEDPYEGVYNTYVLDYHNDDWSLLLHCAEKPKSPRYLTSLIMSKKRSLADNVINFLRDKLPKYDISLDYMFPMIQNKCEEVKLSNYGENEETTENFQQILSTPKRIKNRKHRRPLRRRGDGRKNKSKNDSNMSL